MSQNYDSIQVTEKIYDSLSKILSRDETSGTLSAGTSYPQEIEDWMVGRPCLRLDLQQLSFLESTDPVVWKVMIDFSQEYATTNYVTSNYQPLHQNLTALSSVNAASDKIPYFNTTTTMSTLDVSSFGINMLNLPNASAARSLLGLGNLATVDEINSSNINSYVAPHSVGVNQLAYTPITDSDGYGIADIKETFNTSAETGWITLTDGVSIGNSSSVATYKGDDYTDLYLKLWSLSSTSMIDSSGQPTTKGTTASGDWGANKGLVLPKYFNYFNETATYRIRYK